jgi:transcriptional repressor NrdR
MNCPYCHKAETKVVDKRETNEGTTRRRRECLKCGKRFTTYEKIEDIDLIVIKKDNTRQEFDRSKIEKGIIRACEKRPISYDQIKQVVDDIETELRDKKTKEIQSKEIGEVVIKKLKKLDKVAYIRFASVYREFADVESFEEELRKLIRK